MKKIKTLSILICLLSLSQFVAGQSSAAASATDENGRPLGAKVSDLKTTAPVAQATAAPVSSAEVFNGSDEDVPGARPAYNPGSVVSEWVLPNDLDALQSEVGAQPELASRLAQLEEQVKTLALYNEQLRLENRTVKNSLGNCCLEDAQKPAHGSAYLLQNAPNPFNQVSEVLFFLPKDVQNARLEIKDVNGRFIKSYNIDKAGMGSVSLEAQALKAGAYIYSLYVGNDIIDSKVMIVTQ